jgi:serine/threonine protein kinase
VKEELLPGTCIKSRYLIQKELGRGGMGVVYLAHDQQLMNRAVVVKVLFEETYEDELLVRKFQQEMEALTRVDHPGVVGILDAGELPNGKPFLIMQFIEGVGLHSILTDELVPFHRIARLLHLIGGALNATHEKGIFHRDLKPQNIMIQHPGEQNEQIKLIDFGLAKVLNSKIAESSRAANVVGSFGYMSPEQLTARPVSGASDVYSLGVIAYEMITGRRPFEPVSVFELYDMQRTGIPEDVSGLPRSVPVNAVGILKKALSFDPEQRYSTPQEFCEQLSSALLTPAKVSQVETFKDTGPSQKTTYTRNLLLLTFVPMVALIVIFLKLCFFRFSDWPSFFLQPFALLLILAALVVNLALRKFQRLIMAVNLLVMIFCLYHILTLPEPLNISESTTSSNEFTLNFSDTKGYRYTLVDSPFYLINISPGKWNRLSDYSLELSLSSQIEFADIYFDRKFQLSDQLSLEPSNTNDILLLQKKGDDFQKPRQIKFTYKYRSYNKENSVRVRMKAGNSEFTAEHPIVEIK